MREVEVLGAAGEVRHHLADGGQPLVLHEVDADVEGDEVAVLVGVHAGRQLLEELGPQPRAGQVDLLKHEIFFVTFGNKIQY